MEFIFFEITSVICIAVVFSLIFRFLKQPPILAYLLTGIIVGPLALFQIRDGQEVLQVLSEFGITLLLFTLGLELRFQELKSVGKVAVVAGVGQVVITALLGFLLSLALGFSLVSSVYLAIGLTFSSTIIIVKLLSDKRDLNSLYGKIAIGILLIQDFVAILTLVILSGFENSSGLTIFDFAFVLAKVAALFGIVIYLSKYVLPKIISYVSSSSELLFLFSIAWAFGVAALVSSPLIGFSIEIGGFLAGLALANSTEHFQISARVRPLRDFFITLFFVSLGMNMVFADMLSIVIPATILSFFVLIGGPLVVISILGLMGYRKRTSFFTGLILGQISEFSFILAFMGHNLGHIPAEVVSTITFVGVVTFVFSTYFILHGNDIYKKMHRYLSFMERKKGVEHHMELGELKDHVVLIGANRTGMSILHALEQSSHTFVVVDFNPDIVKKIQEKNGLSLFGDIADHEIQEKAHLHTAKVIISTVPDVKDNLILLDSIHKMNKKAKVIVFAQNGDDEKMLYKHGADYVVIPHFSGGVHVAHIIEEDNLDKIRLLKQKGAAAFS